LSDGENQRDVVAIGQAPVSELVRAELVEKAELVQSPEPILPLRRQRRIVLPVILFLLTCLSTFFVGAVGWNPFSIVEVTHRDFLNPGSAYFMLPTRLMILDHWQQGLVYAFCLLAILMTHEMGHFVMTVIYRVRASLPYFLPLPISPLGTMGAVIGMDGSSANRRQIFDIGLAGPIAGLIVAVPVIWIGVKELDLAAVQPLGPRLEMPLAIRWLLDYVHPGAYDPQAGIALNQLNAYFMAGWVGLLVTGLNMMPVSQLDGGHVTYALFGRTAHWVARFFMLFVFIYMGVAYWLYQMPPSMILMAVLVLLMGTDHPPTRDDTVRLGWLRYGLGVVSLLIPVLCLHPNPIRG
jgi:membrane-associated protease RseP (regulator of RpoE activity)